MRVKHGSQCLIPSRHSIRVPPAARIIVGILSDVATTITFLFPPSKVFVHVLCSFAFALCHRGTILHHLCISYALNSVYLC